MICFFCKRNTSKEFYCFGCQTTICYKCDNDGEIVTYGHKSPLDHVKSVNRKKIMRKKKTKLGLNTKQFQDKWSQVKGDLEALASEQVSADIALVESERALKSAQLVHTKAVARKSLAQKRLETLRGNLGAD